MSIENDSLFRDQEKFGQIIQNIITNFKKDSANRKTKKEYFEIRKEQLNDAWARFEETDNKIRELAEIPYDNAYFSNDYYGKIQNMYNQYIKIFDDTLTSFKIQENKKSMASDTTNVDVPNNSKDDDNTKIISMMRRQSAMSASLQRLLTAIDRVKDTSSSYSETQLLSVSKLWNEIECLHYSIWEECPDPINIGYDMEFYISLEQSVHNYQILLESNKRNTDHNVNKNESVIQLPKIVIPKFDGDYLKWQQFSDIFTKMIHEQEMSSVQKMWYLKGNVCGEAERLIRHLPLSDENYESAWKIMQERFNNKRVLATTLIKKIVEQATISSEANSIKNFHDSIKGSLLALNNMDIPTTTWDPLLLHILTRKLDHFTNVLYEQTLKNPREIQTIDEFLTFLQNRFHSLEALGKKDKLFNKKTVTSIVQNNNKPNCAYCSADGHIIYYCEKFLKIKADERLKWIQKQKRCVNCLRPGHDSRTCLSQNCKKCSLKHNTLLHLDCYKQKNKNMEASTFSQPSNSPTEKNQLATLTAANNITSNTQYVLLATAKILVAANNGQVNTYRAILDSGSQVNLVTERLIKQLAIKPSTRSLVIEGIGQGIRNSNRRVNLTMRSLNGKFSSRFEAFVLPQIVSPQPTQHVNISDWKIPKNLELADNEFFRKNKIDVLLGAEFYHELLLPEQIRLGQNLPIMQNSMFGWLVCGRVDNEARGTVTCAIYNDDDSPIDKLIERFWRLEDLNISDNNHTTAEEHCEKHFIQNVRRDRSGRFIVRLPFSENPSSLGDSNSIALARFLALEKRLNKDKAQGIEYIKFMKEYELLNHMNEIQLSDIPESHYIIPHHSIIKPDKSTTKLRVVFDASAKTSSGLSLNDILHFGPTVQSDLFSILLRFRFPKFVFTTDIEKMYRQIGIDSRDQCYQIIMWRDNPANKIKYYQLKTVTYGTTSAPYLATKCLQFLAKQHMVSHPLGAQILQNDFYVDDCLSGSNNLATAIDMQGQLISLLKSAGFKTHKWCGNHPKLLQGIPREEQELDLDLGDNKSAIKTLGLTWTPKIDAFCIKIQISNSSSICKRTVTSNLAQIFDPLGMLGPVVVVGKLFIQQLWEMKLTWDEELPTDLKNRWMSFRSNLSTLNQEQIPRHIFNKQIPLTIQLHVFADASEKAYGAVAYIRSTYSNKQVLVRLLCSKSRVAPLKKQTLPRLELCAALLGAELATRVSKDLQLDHLSIYLWTDSEIVLQWINSTASSFHTFVANRVSKIQQLTTARQWRHVRSHHNPADILSRGLNPEKLLSNTLWFYGPIFLHGAESAMPRPFDKALSIESELEKRQRNTALAVLTNPTVLEDLIYNLNHRNSFKFLLRVIAYVLRFIRHIKGQKNIPSHKALTPEELHEAQVIVIKTVQGSDFKEDIKGLRKHKTVLKSSPLATLNSFIDSQGIIRVGGRLESSELSYNAKHPVILPYNDFIAKLIIKDIHEENMHCGAQTLLNLVRMNFWPIKGKITVRNIIHNCVRCTRARPRLMNQIMGNLPTDRITPARPFLNAGVDYWGPIWVHYKIRGKKPCKVYVAVFCCFSTKAIHLEVVSDLTTEAFIAALKRFISRRGRCKTLYCDNATNFVGANNQLRELNSSIHSNAAQERIINTCSQKGIEFKFIPPRAPHFGGLWEAAVKSAKHLLLKNISTTSLTYEELETVIVETEAILNSRPLTPLSADPKDLSALTPGHFLIGEPLVAQVDVPSKDSKASLTTRWRLISQLKQEFWSRWMHEYLQELQQRYKWRQQVENIKEGTMVIIKEDSSTPLEWPLGRIIRTYKGNDGSIRVVDVKTSKGVWKRPIHRLAPLPVETSNDCESYLTNEEDDDPAPTKKKRYSLLSPIALTLLLIFFPITSAQSINTTRFTNFAGLYFENVGKVNLVTAEWKIIAYYDLTPIREELNLLSKGTNYLQHLCNQLPQNSSCAYLVSHYLNVMTELQSDNKILLKQRNKRAALDIIGNIANKLFGVLDSDYANDMSKTINRINNNEIHINDILKTHTSVIDSTINIIKRNQEETNASINQVNNRLNELSKEVNQEAIRTNTLQQFTLLSIQLSTIVAELQRVIGSVLNVLTDTHHGKISPLLISPLQLRKEAINIRNHLSPYQQLPVQEDDLLHLLNFMTSQAGISNHHIVFSIKFPLIDQEQFDLFQILPIPAIYHNYFISIESDTEFLATNSHRNQYFPVSLSELKLCRQLKESIYMCTDKQSKFNRGSSLFSCEIHLLNNDTTSDCKTKNSTGDLIWNQIFHKNQWIYATQGLIPMTAVCGSSLSQFQLRGTGLLSIQPDCVVKNSFITIRGHPIISSTIHASYASFGNFTEMLQKPINNSIKINEPNNTATLHDRSDQLLTLQNVLKSTEVINYTNQKEFDKVHQYIISYSSLSLSVIIMCILAWIITRYIRKNQNSVKVPPPKPKRHFSQSAFEIHDT